MPTGIKFRNKKNQSVYPYPYPYFPVGSIYMTTHTLTTAEMPAHSHTAGSYDGYVIDNTGFASGVKAQCVRANTSYTSTSIRIKTNNTGSGTAHNNIPPDFAVYIWRRTA